MQLFSGLVRGISALGSCGGFHCGTRECLQVMLPVSCTVVRYKIQASLIHKSQASYLMPHLSTL